MGGAFFNARICASYSAIFILLNLLSPSRLNASSAHQQRSAHFLIYSAGILANLLRSSYRISLNFFTLHTPLLSIYSGLRDCAK
jgi:hypothetical protein